MEKTPRDAPLDEENDFVWSRIECKDSGKRVDHASLLYKNYIITFGGFNGSYLNDIIAFDITRYKWKSIQAFGMSPTPRCGHSICLYDNNKVVVFGGRNESVVSEFGIMTLGEASSNVSRSLHLAKSTLTVGYDVIKEASQNSPQRTYHSTIINGKEMLIFAGKDQTGESTNNLWSIDLDTYTWRLIQTSGNQPEKRYGHCSVSYKGQMYIFGGHSTQKKIKFNDIWKLDIEKMKWEKVISTGIVPSPRSGASAQEREGKVYFFGGYKDDADCTNELSIYDINSNSWDLTKTSDEAPSSRCYHTSICFKNNLFVWGGFDGDYLSDIFCFILPKDLTEEMSKNAPIEQVVRAREGHPVLKKLFTEKRFADVIFEVQGEEISAHRAILAERCKFFDNMFSSGMSESKKLRVKITDIRWVTFKAFIEFLYCDELKVNEELALELLKLADKYMTEDLKMSCEKALTNFLKLDNFFALAKTAEVHNAAKLKEAVLDFAAKHSKAISQREELTDLPKTILVEIIGKFASRLY